MRPNHSEIIPDGVGIAQAIYQSMTKAGITNYEEKACVAQFESRTDLSNLPPSLKVVLRAEVKSKVARLYSQKPEELPLPASDHADQVRHDLPDSNGSTSQSGLKETDTKRKPFPYRDIASARANDRLD